MIDALDCWLSQSEFKESHVAALYRTAAADPARANASWVSEKGDAPTAGDAVAEVLGFPSPFVAANLGDRKGIWQSEPPLKKQLGEDPSSQFRANHYLCQGGARRKAVAPAGFRNLGATCYLNSLLQYMFFNADFRYSLLDARSESEVVQALQKVFALMLDGKRNVVDPSEFVRVTGVDAVEQEDATEFSTLLLDWLERALGQGDKEHDKGGAFIPALFQGEVSQVVTCLEQPGHAFERREAFYELRARLTLTSGTEAGKAAPSAAPPRRGGGAAAPAPPAPPPALLDMAPGVAASASAQGVAAAAAAEGAAAETASKSGPGRKRKEKGPPPPLVTLEELLADTAFPDEMLCGSNKYHCSKCDRKVDARKSIRLATPPAYLHITVERYHYDLQKGERRKLNNPVSFPQHLRLRLARPSGEKTSDSTAAAPGAPEAAAGGAASQVDDLVAYDCVGFLEHVSDSAHSGHYIATLYQEDEDAIGALALASDAASVTSAASGAEAQGPPPKRQRCDGPDAAAGEPRRGLWWTLDDLTVSPVAWRAGRAHIATGTSDPEAPVSADESAAPARIESVSAYLVLYRRRSRRHEDDTRCGCPWAVPARLASVVAEDNATLTTELQAFRSQSSAVEAFLKQRRAAVMQLLQALRAAPTQVAAAEAAAGAPRALPPLVVVPTPWLDAFLRGEDRSLQELLEGRLRPKEVSYARALLRSPTCPDRQILDPLAVWCGEVKLIPADAFDQLGGAGGLDSTLFVPFEEAAAPEACKAAWSLHKLFQQEWLQIRKLLSEGKVAAPEARQLQADGRGEEAVWLPLKVQRLWQKVLGGTGGTAKGQAWELLALRAFLREVHEARWGGRAWQDEGKPEDGLELQEFFAAPRCAEPRVRAAGTGGLDRCEVHLTEGLLCPHGRVGNPRAAFLVRRVEVETLLELSAAKGKAYRALWPHVRVVPQYRGGPRGQLLLPSAATCSVCQGKASPSGEGTTAATSAAAAAAAASQRKLCVKRRYASKVLRKVGQLPVPDGDEAPTGAALRELVRELLSFTVSSLRVEVQGEEMDLGNDQPLEDAVETIIVEKDETEPPAREASAFSGSIFRS